MVFDLLNYSISHYVLELCIEFFFSPTIGKTTETIISLQAWSSSHFCCRESMGLNQVVQHYVGFRCREIEYFSCEANCWHHLLILPNSMLSSFVIFTYFSYFFHLLLISVSFSDVVRCLVSMLIHLLNKYQVQV